MAKDSMWDIPTYTASSDLWDIGVAGRIVTEEFFGLRGLLRWWTGVTWEYARLRRWSGTSWNNLLLKVWSGTDWKYTQ